ncbi:hypothetical protein CMV_015281 [Castanea mollissima]|uniref:Uncharacterized protein n=1 Tax=Castanea mollissima TaxID=60419 RepID=A0A8J4QV65_9ROSI|nr:hypothetical protein CMV_015281 [Castanea mollissima]
MKFKIPSWFFVALKIHWPSSMNLGFIMVVIVVEENTEQTFERVPAGKKEQLLKIAHNLGVGGDEPIHREILALQDNLH